MHCKPSRAELFLRIIKVSYLRAYMGLKSESKSTRLGYVWWIVEPAMHLAVYYTVFEVLLKRGGENFGLFLLVGIVHWLWFSKSIMNASQSIIIGRGLILQLPLQTIIFPLAELMRDFFKQLIVAAVLLLTLMAAGAEPTYYWLCYPLITLAQLMLIVPTASLIAALQPLLPDLRVLVPAGLQLGMFLSGVFFTKDSIPVDYQWLLNFNPIYLLLEAYRDVLLRDQAPDWSLLGKLALTLTLFTSVVLLLFAQLNRKFARIVQE